MLIIEPRVSFEYSKTSLLAMIKVAHICGKILDKLF